MELQKAAYWRLPLAAATLAALFWGAWWLVAGAVPNGSFEQVELSRWLDVPCAAAFTLAALLTAKLVSNLDKDYTYDLVFALGVILFYGLIFGLFVGLIIGLGFGLGFGLFVGLIIGLGFGLAASLGIGLAYCLDMTIKSVRRLVNWRRVGAWLLGHR